MAKAAKVRYYNNTIGEDRQITAEEDIATTIFDLIRSKEDDQVLTEEDCADLGRNILKQVLLEFRPDCFVGSEIKKHIHVNARRWFDKINGNTYHSVSVVMPDGTIRTSGQTYGYGQQYEATAIALVLGEYPKHENGNPMPPWRWYE